MRYTAPVRRGFGHLVTMDLPNNVEAMIAHGQRLGLARDDKIPARTAADLRAAVAWIIEEGKRQDVIDEGKADVGSEGTPRPSGDAPSP